MSMLVLGHGLKVLRNSFIRGEVRSIPSSYRSSRSYCQQEFSISKRAEFRMAQNVFRQQKFYKAIVENIFDASELIKVLRLYVPEAGFAFKAGQWVDFYAPGIEDVTGYSMTSAPYEAIETGILDLAVKYGKFPPTHWVHTKCQVQQEVMIRVGGDFFYDPQPDTPSATADLLLVGGGVGINPLVSILCEYCHILNSSKSTHHHSSIKPGNVNLLYSAKTEEELIFKDTFEDMEKEHSSLSCQYFVTRRTHPLGDKKIQCHRIGERQIADAVERLKKDNTLCYICGPSNMTDEVAAILSKMGVRQDFIRFEKWW